MLHGPMMTVALALRGARPRQPLPFVPGRSIVLVHGLGAMTLVMAAGFVWLAWLMAGTGTPVGWILTAVFGLCSLPPLARLVPSLLCATARVAPGVVDLARMPPVTLSRRRFPAGAFALGVRPWHWSRSRGRGARARTDTALGWAFTLERPGAGWMLPVVLEVRWQGPGPEDLPDAAAARAHGAALARSLGLRSPQDDPQHDPQDAAPGVRSRG